ncbi:MAG: UDP-2,3-diacylglucosamine diphosphatase [Alphaproteobacteria bacterium]
MTIARSRPRSHRTIFLSDIHLGSRGCQAETLLDFLRVNEAERIYLIGDIVDCWSLRRSWYWPQSHNDVVQKLLRKARKGTEIIYVPGNHDEVFRDYCGTHFGGVEVMREALHETADGRRLLVVHGDAFDGIVQYARWLALLGDWSYAWLLRINRGYNRLRRMCGFGYWSLSAYLKFKVKNAVKFIDNYEQAVAAEARRRGADGVICGHIHHAEITSYGGIRYINTGDWVESCTAVVEDFDGRLSIVRWGADAPLSLTAPTSDKRRAAA